MKRPLLFLSLRTRRNALVRFVVGLKAPKRLFGTLLTLGLLAFMAVSMVQGGKQADRSTAPAILTIYLSFTLVMSFFGGFLEPGVPFTPSEIDFLLPGPFSLRALVVYRVTSLYPATLLGAVIPFLLFGIATRNPGLGFAGIALSGVVGWHLRILVSILAIRLDETALRRLRGPLRLVALALGLGLMAVIVAYVTKFGGARAVIASVAASPAAQYVFFPAVAASRMATAHGLEAAAPWLLGAIACAVGTMIPLLLLRVNFLEASIGVSERLAARRARWRRGGGVAGLESTDRRPAAGRLPRLPVFRGAGAIAWKNLLLARRSWRTLLFRLVLSALFIPIFLTGERGLVTALIAVGVFPLIVMSVLAYDFRTERAHMARLKALPVSRFGVAVAEVAVPTLLALTLQAVLLGVLAGLGRVPVLWLPLLLLGCAPASAGMVAATNVAHLIVARGPPAGILQFVLVILDLVLVVLLGAVLQNLGVAWPLTLAVAWAFQVVLLAALLAWLGAVFSGHDVAADVVV